jgi:hypothetical protein
MLHIEAAHVIQLFGQPEEQEEPSRVAHGFCEHQRLHTMYSDDLAEQNPIPSAAKKTPASRYTVSIAESPF